MTEKKSGIYSNKRREQKKKKKKKHQVKSREKNYIGWANFKVDDELFANIGSQEGDVQAL